MIGQILMYGEKTLMPYLLNRGIAVVDYIIISHFDTDHVRRIVLYHGKHEGKKCDNC